jgi:hypothetical protein
LDGVGAGGVDGGVFAPGFLDALAGVAAAGGVDGATGAGRVAPGSVDAGSVDAGSVVGGSVVGGSAEVAVARVGSAGSSVAIVTSYRMIDRNDHTWADWVRDMV